MPASCCSRRLRHLSLALATQRSAFSLMRKHPLRPGFMCFEATGRRRLTIEALEDRRLLAVGDLVINEIMQNPSVVDDSVGEYFELHNLSTADIDIEGFWIGDDDNDSHIINHGSPLIVPAGGYFVLGRNNNTSVNGGVSVDYQYSGFFLANGADEIELRDVSGLLIDRVAYDNGATFPDPTGAAMELTVGLTDPATDNDAGGNWTTAITMFGAGDSGSPGSPNSTIAPPGSGPDVGDTLLTAGALDPPAIGGSVDVDSTLGDGPFTTRDVDLFELTVTAGDQLRIETGTANGEFPDTVLRLFDALGSELAFNDDGGQGLFSLITYTAPTSGTLYVGVGAFPNFDYEPAIGGSGDAADAGSLGDYSLSIDRVVPANGTVSGVLWHDIDADGVRQPSEEGLVGWRVFADLNDNGFRDSDEPTAVSISDDPGTGANEAGRYTLDSVPVGTIVIRQEVPPGWDVTFPFATPVANSASAMVIAGPSAVLDFQGDVNQFVKRIAVGDPGGVPPVTVADRVDANVPSSAFAGVVSLNMSNADGSFICSGAMISEIHVVTAGHCLDSDDNGSVDYSPNEVRVFFNHNNSTNNIGGSTGIFATALDNHPDYTGFLAPSLSDDIAVVTLGQPAPAGVPVYPINTSPFLNARQTILAGYGTRGDAINGEISGSSDFFSKLTGENIASQSQNDDEGSGVPEVWFADFDGPGSVDLLGDGPTLGNDREVTILGGDSGGPSFVWTDGNSDDEITADELIWWGNNTFGDVDAPDFDTDFGGMIGAAYAGWLQSFLTPPEPPGPLNGAWRVEVLLDQTVGGFDFGNRFTDGATLRGTYWDDLDGNGIHEAGEPGLAGQMIYLDANSNSQMDAGEQSVTTGGDGTYAFENLLPGDYRVGVVVAPGHTQTSPVVVSALAGSAVQVGFSAKVAPPRLSVGFMDRYSAVSTSTADHWGIVTNPSLVTIAELTERLGGTIEPVVSVPGGFVWTPADESARVVLGEKVPIKGGEVGDGITRTQRAQMVRQLDGVKAIYPLLSTQQVPRAVPNDPLYPDQWHLNNTGQNGGTIGQDIDVESVWDSYRGGGVTIAVVDDGLQHSHPDLSTNYLPAASYDFNDDDADPTPTSAGDDHGTSAAGVAAATGFNNQGVTGAAPDANLSGLRLIAGPSSDADEAGALTFAGQLNDIYSNSWGPTDDPSFAGYTAAGLLTQAGFAAAVQSGRGGLGSIYVWAAGNGLTDNDNVNYDGYANSRYTIAVSAIDHDGRQSWYSEPGAPILVAAHSSGQSGISTTDLLGDDGDTGIGGYGNGDYTDNFGGTSSATPLAAGVIALMLQANPALTWRDVQAILVETAVQNDAGDIDWSTNGAGHLINHKYGFGAINAATAVAAAETWVPLAAEMEYVSLIGGAIPIPDNDATGVVDTISVPVAISIESVSIDVSMSHGRSGDLEFVLQSPDGTQSILSTANDSTVSDLQWTFNSMRHWGESSAGDWNLTVRDRAGGTTGTLDAWQLIFNGTSLDSEVSIDGSGYLVSNVQLGNVIEALDFGSMETTPSDTEAPTVTSVIAAGASWSNGFIDAVDGSGSGAGNGLGYVLAGGGNPTPMPWSTIDTLYVTFSEDVLSVTSSDLQVLSGATNGSISIAAITYDQLTFTAVVTLSAPLGGDRIRLAVNDSVIDIAGNSLDGDGDGDAGGLHELVFEVLPGDINGDGNVTALDLGQLGTAFNTQVGSPGFNLSADINADDNVTALDLGILGANFNTTVGSIDAPPAASFVSNASARSLLATDDYFSKLENKLVLLAHKNPLDS